MKPRLAKQMVKGLRLCENVTTTGRKRQMIHQQYEVDDHLHEECGVFGIYDMDGNDVASTIYMVFLLCSTEVRRVAVSR